MSTPKPEIKIEIDEETARGVYTNLALISHTETEFVLDFTFIMPNSPKTKVLTRIITSPTHAKRFLAALEDNIAKFEARFGAIDKGTAETPPNTSDYYQ